MAAANDRSHANLARFIRRYEPAQFKFRFLTIYMWPNVRVTNAYVRSAVDRSLAAPWTKRHKKGKYNAETDADTERVLLEIAGAFGSNSS